jgi:uncharacterized protein (TIGR03067 family)
MFKRAAWVVLAGLAAGFAPAPFPKPADKVPDQKKLQGTWKVVRFARGDTDMTASYARFDRKVVIAGDSWMWQLGGRPSSIQYTLALDPKKKPRTFDLQRTLPARPGRPVPPRTYLRGIYQIEGDTLKLCYANSREERPTSFTAAGSNHIHMTLKREKR